MDGDCQLGLPTGQDDFAAEFANATSARSTIYSRLAICGDVFVELLVPLVTIFHEKSCVFLFVRSACRVHGYSFVVLESAREERQIGRRCAQERLHYQRGHESVTRRN